MAYVNFFMPFFLSWQIIWHAFKRNEPLGILIKKEFYTHKLRGGQMQFVHVDFFPFCLLSQIFTTEKCRYQMILSQIFIPDFEINVICQLFLSIWVKNKSYLPIWVGQQIVYQDEYFFITLIMRSISKPPPIMMPPWSLSFV